MVTRSSRATAPLKNVTTRLSPWSSASTTNPGASRSWTAPKSRSASQTSSGDASITACFVIDAMGSPDTRLRSDVGAAHGPVELADREVGGVSVLGDPGTEVPVRVVHVVVRAVVGDDRDVGGGQLAHLHAGRPRRRREQRRDRDG